MPRNRNVNIFIYILYIESICNVNSLFFYLFIYIMTSHNIQLSLSVSRSIYPQNLASYKALEGATAAVANYLYSKYSVVGYLTGCTFFSYLFLYNSSYYLQKQYPLHLFGTTSKISQNYVVNL